jgi:hypothetical protein
MRSSRFRNTKPQDDGFLNFLQGLDLSNPLMNLKCEKNNKDEPDEIATSQRTLLAMTDLVDEILANKRTRARGREGEKNKGKRRFRMT